MIRVSHEICSCARKDMRVSEDVRYEQVSCRMSREFECRCKYVRCEYVSPGYNSLSDFWIVSEIVLSTILIKRRK